MPKAALGAQRARLPTAPHPPRAPALGAFLQELTNYHYRVAFVGDITERIERSKAHHAFVHESNGGCDVLIVKTREELEAQL